MGGAVLGLIGEGRGHDERDAAHAGAHKSANSIAGSTGSTHRSIAGLDLVVTLDDATGAIYSAIFVAEEGTMSSFLGLFETIAEQGLFRAFYTDRGSHYFFTPKAGGKSLPRC